MDENIAAFVEMIIALYVLGVRVYESEGEISKKLKETYSTLFKNAEIHGMLRSWKTVSPAVSCKEKDFVIKYVLKGIEKDMDKIIENLKD